MNSIIKKSFGGLTLQYYVRQFLFGLIFPAIIVFVLTEGESNELTIFITLFCVINTILYPYSRFVYESIIGYVVGDNFIISNMLVFVITKIMTMCLCWSAAIFIAPVGLIYLYFYHSKNEN